MAYGYMKIKNVFVSLTFDSGVVGLKTCASIMFSSQSIEFKFNY